MQRTAVSVCKHPHLHVSVHIYSQYIFAKVTMYTCMYIRVTLTFPDWNPEALDFSKTNSGNISSWEPTPESHWSDHSTGPSPSSLLSKWISTDYFSKKQHEHRTCGWHCDKAAAYSEIFQAHWETLHFALWQGAHWGLAQARLSYTAPWMMHMCNMFFTVTGCVQYNVLQNAMSTFSVLV